MRFGKAITPMAAGLVLVLASCASPVPTARLVDVARSGVPMETLAKGRDTYIRKCSGCHALHAPDDYDDAVWAGQVAEMREEACISEDDADLILTYLRAMNVEARRRTP